MKKLNILLILLFFGVNLVRAQVPAPTNLTAQFKQENHPGMMGYGYVELKWQMPQSSYGYLFKVFRMGPNDTSYRQIASGLRDKEFYDYYVQPQSTYSYYVVAYNYQGISDPSNTASVTTPPVPDVVRFVTLPPKLASLGVLYTYDADAVSNQATAVITYSLVEGPADLTVDSVTGIVTWTPSAGGYFKVKIKAESNLGGKAFQEWSIKVNGPTGTISGTVTNSSDNSALAGVTVFFINTNSTRHEVAYTDQNGQYSKQLVEGNYKIKFYKRGFVPEFFDNKGSIDSADVVTVTANTTFVANADLTPVAPPTLYTISGSVLDANGQPVKSVVTAFVVKDTTFPILPPTPRNMSAVTDSLGNYQLRVIGGFQYVVYAKPFNRNYYPEFWDNKRTFQEADRILVNSNVENINFVLEQKPVYNNGIAGLVKDFNNGNPVEAVVSVFKLNNGRFKPFKSTRTDSLGNYLVENLEPGNYIVFAKPQLPYLPGYYKADTVAFRWRDADTVVVSENGIVENININLVTRPDTGFAKISGYVRTVNGDPVSGAVVLTYNLNGEVVAYSISSNDGSYQIENLVAGDYTLVVDATEYENASSDNSVSLNYGSNPSTTKDLYLNPESTTGVKSNSPVPSSYSLSQNYPNPFNPSTQIRFTIPEKTNVKLEVYNLIGQKVADLVNSELSAGEYSITFNASGLSSGIYLYRLQAGNFSSVKKMILMK
jgi:hypothetical protein